MALTVTSRGTGTHNTGATTLVPGGRSATLAVGSMGVLCISADNAGSAGAALMGPASWNDAKGNVWTLRTNALYDNGAASAGVEMMFYTAPITVALLTTDLGTITWAGGVSPVAKVWAWYEVIPSGSNTVAYMTGGSIAGATAANATVVTASVTVGNAVIAGYFSENVAAVTGDSDTTNGTWTAQQTATVGTTTSGVRIATQQKVQTTTASTQSYDVTVLSQDRIAGYIMLGESASVSSSLTANAILIVGRTGSFSADAILKKTISSSFTADSVLRRTQTGSLTADAALKKTISSSFTADAVLFRTISGSVAVDAVLKKTISSSVTADSILGRTQSGSFAADSILLRTISGSFTADSVLKRTQSASLTSDAILFRTQAGSLTFDAITLRTQSGSFTANAITIRTQSGSLSADALIVRNVLHDTFSRVVVSGLGTADDGTVYQQETGGIGIVAVDGTAAITSGLTDHRFIGYELPSRSLVQFDFNVAADTSAALVYEVDTWSEKAPTFGNTYNKIVVLANGDGTWQALLGNGASDPFTPDASTWYTVKAWLSDTVSRVKVWKVGDPEPDWDVSSSALPTDEDVFESSLRIAGVALSVAALDNLSIWDASGSDIVYGDLPADAVIFRTQTGSVTADSVLLVSRAGTFVADAINRATQSGSWAADSIILKTQSGSVSANAILKATEFGSISGSLTADAILYKLQTSSLSADASITQSQTGSFSANAVVLRITSATLGANAVLRASRAASISADAIKSKTATASLNADAVLRQGRTSALTADAVLLRPQTGNATANAVILRVQSGSFSADAVLAPHVSSGSFTADAVIRRERTGSISANAVVRAARSGSFTADASFISATEGVITADAVLVRGSTSSFTADAILRKTLAGGFSADAWIALHHLGDIYAVLEAANINAEIAAAPVAEERVSATVSAANIWAHIGFTQTTGSFTADAVLV